MMPSPSIQELYKIPDPEQVHSDDYQKLNRRLGTTDRAEEWSGIAQIEIDRLASALHINEDHLGDFYECYFSAVETELVQNTSIAMLTSGVVYFVCRKKSIPRSLRSVSKSSAIDSETMSTDEWGTHMNSSNKLVGKTFRQISQEFSQLPMQIKVKEFIEWYTQILESNNKIHHTCLDIIDIIEKSDFNCSNHVLAASIIYLAYVCHDHTEITQKKLGRVASISDTSIGKTYSKIRNKYSSQIEEYDVDGDPYIADATWMKNWHRNFLEILKEKQPLSLDQLGEVRSRMRRLHTYKYINKFCRSIGPLYEYGLIQFTEKGIQLTVDGFSYLSNELRADELDPVWPHEICYRLAVEIVSQKEPYNPNTRLYRERNHEFIELARRGFLMSTKEGYNLTEQGREYISNNNISIDDFSLNKNILKPTQYQILEFLDENGTSNYDTINSSVTESVPKYYGKLHTLSQEGLVELTEGGFSGESKYKITDEGKEIIDKIKSRQ